VKLIRAMNNFFFGSDSISLHDVLWFYGMNGLFLVVTIVFLIKLITI